MSTIADRVMDVAAAILNVPRESLTAQSSPSDVESWDSMQHLQIILALEEAFGLKFAAHEIDKMQSIGAMTAALEGRQAS
jgi:acyl carrier protein